MNWQNFQEIKPKKSGFYAVIYDYNDKKISIGYYHHTLEQFLYPVDKIVCEEYKNVVYWCKLDKFPCREELINGAKI